MRLLDQIVQSTAPLLVRQDSGEVWRLPSAADYAGEVARCPLRYVLTDELLRVCLDLAYSEGAEVSGCLDLLHVPAEHMWIEWSAAAQREELARVLPECVTAEAPDVLYHGVLISAQPSGRIATLRTFWSPRADPPDPMLAAVETLLNLECGMTPAPPAALFDGGAVGVHDLCNPQLDRLLRHAAFRVDPLWQQYYRSAACTPEKRADVVHRLLATVAFDIPMLLALFLLMALRVGLPQVPVARARLNAKRARFGRHPLLEHIEVSSPLFATAALSPTEQSTAMRGAPRFHHVRGHIVRRSDAIFWRRPHWRGHLRLGCVRTRTVELRLAERATLREL